MWIVHEPKENPFPDKNTDSKDRLCLPENSIDRPDQPSIHGGRLFQVLAAENDTETIANSNSLMTTRQMDSAKDGPAKIERKMNGGNQKPIRTNNRAKKKCNGTKQNCKIISEIR